ncbi:hypothetical protein [Lysinibacillus sp. Ag94]|uniref:hypothetical protein n=1 Tax=Lysinibacillus sp. Ag94 TaxID=2936682 RepID=UPI0020104528|nr:hypothetical protein [Lysinibacillus sp. Ag94]UPW84733.1 hypothetical protein MY533_07740 [Lysinibacillus sp. Ag94]
MSNEAEQDFEAAIAESVNQMLVELNLNEKAYLDIEQQEPESWNKLKEMCTEFVNKNFNLPGVEDDKTYNYFISNVISYRMLSAYCMLPIDEMEYEEGKTDFWAWSELFNIYREITDYDWELLGDVGKEVILKVPKEKVIKRDITYLELLFEKMKNNSSLQYKFYGKVYYILFLELNIYERMEKSN